MISKPKKIYPKCIHGLQHWLHGSQKRMKVYNNIKPQIFDVTLRDGLQTIPNDSVHLWSIKEKKDLYYHIKFNYNPLSIEIGSLVNPKILPIFENSLELFRSIENDIHYTPNYYTGIEKTYMLVPNMNMLYLALKNDITNLSFLTSVSDLFQKKNTNMSLAKTKKELMSMTSMLDDLDKLDNPVEKKIKLYISCINKCPIMGPIDNDFIIHEILYYQQNQRINEICLSDTCGTLKFEDFEYIIDTCLHFGLLASRISLHLHCSDETYDNTKQIIQYAFSKKINKFDVSMMEGGGVR